MKQIMSILDIRAISNELNSRLANSFIQNFYSFEQRFIYIRLSNKDCLMIEPGHRMHLTTEYETEISHFCKKLREKCRHAKIHKIYQYSYERIIIIDILRYRLAIEFFSGGNIIIIDENDIIIDLLRPVKDLSIVKGSRYVFNKVEVVPDFDQFKVNPLEDLLPFENEYIQMIKMEIEELALFGLGIKYDYLKNDKYKKEVDGYFMGLIHRIDNLGGFGEVTLTKNRLNQLFSFKTIKNAITINHKQKAEEDECRKVKLDDDKNEDNAHTKLSDDNGMASYNNPSDRLDDDKNEDNAHTKLSDDNGMASHNNPSDRLDDDKNEDNAHTKLSDDNGMASYNNPSDRLDDDKNEDNAHTKLSDDNGMASHNNPSKSANKDILKKFEAINLELKHQIHNCDFEKIEEVLRTHKNVKALHFTSLCEAAEYYFKGTKKQKKSKEDKSIRIKKAQEKYILELGIQADSNQEIAEILERNKDFVYSILETFKRVYESKMEWKDFDVFWDQERINANPMAQAIELYDLKRKTCVVKLEDSMIELDLRLTLSKNIEKYYQKRKKAIDKGNKTVAALDNIIGSLDSKKKSVKVQKRVPFWFEKFHFFISSANELVIGGKNAQQNELLVKNHLDPTDLYFHCDVHGASSIICKGRSENTIAQASYMSMCMSTCWIEGVTRPVFYVEPDQVSKTTPSGEFINKGAFMIRGKKTIMNPYRLEYGVGIIFKLQNSVDIIDFSSNPTFEDKILFGMPVCAPWSLVEEYKYRVRICPGNEKKSKLCQDIMKEFHKISVDTPEESNVKAIGIEEYMGVVIGKSRLAKITK